MYLQEAEHFIFQYDFAEKFMSLSMHSKLMAHA